MTAFHLDTEPDPARKEMNQVEVPSVAAQVRFVMTVQLVIEEAAPETLPHSIHRARRLRVVLIHASLHRAAPAF